MNYTYLYICIIFLAIIYNIISYVNINKLVSIIIIIIIGYILIYAIYINDKNIKENDINSDKILDNNLKNLIQPNTDKFYISKIPKNLKYLNKDDKLVKIIENISFIKKFNKSCYTNILINCDKMMKIYIYILSDRYHVDVYLPLILDLRNDILEYMYSLVLIIPIKFKHTYGFDTYLEINKTIKNFIRYSRKMITIIERYGKIDKNIIYLQDTIYRTYNDIKNKYNIMP